MIKVQCKINIIVSRQKRANIKRYWWLNSHTNEYTHEKGHSCRHEKVLYQKENKTSIKNNNENEGNDEVALGSTFIAFLNKVTLKYC